MPLQARSFDGCSESVLGRGGHGQLWINGLIIDTVDIKSWTCKVSVSPELAAAPMGLVVVATLNIELSIAQSFSSTHPVIPQVDTR